MTTRDSQNSREQWTKERTNKSKWKAVMKAFHEAGLIKETKASWHNSKESQKRGYDLLTQTEEVKCQNSGQDDQG